MLTIACDEDMTIGTMLANGDAPKDSDVRLALFVLYAAREWDVLYDPRKIRDEDEPRAFVWDEEDEESMRPAREGDTQVECWYLFEGLDDAVVR